MGKQRIVLVSLRLCANALFVDEGKISGLLVQTHDRVLESRLGSERFRQYREQLTSADRSAIEAASPLTWISIGVSDRMFEVAARVCEKEKWALHDEIVAEGTEQAVKLIWRMLLTVVNDELLFSRASLIMKKAYDRGHAEGKIIAPGHAEFIVTEWPSMPDRVFHGLRVSIGSFMRVARRKDVTVTARRTPDGAVYDVRWKV